MSNQSTSTEENLNSDGINPTNVRSHFILLSEKKGSNRKYRCKKCNWEAFCSGRTRLSQHIQGRAKIGHTWDAKECKSPDPEMKAYLLANLESLEEKERKESLFATENIDQDKNGIEIASKNKKKKISHRKTQENSSPIETTVTRMMIPSSSSSSSSSSSVSTGNASTTSTQRMDAELAWEYLFDHLKQVDSSGQMLMKRLEELGVTNFLEMMLLNEEEIEQLADCLKPIPRKGFILMMKGKWSFR